MRIKRDVDRYDLSISIIVLIAILGCMMILSSCVSTRKKVNEGIKADTDRVEKTADRVTDEAHEDKTMETNKMEKTWVDIDSNVDIVYEVYDTERTDGDGEHPVKERTTIKGSKKESNMKEAEETAEEKTEKTEKTESVDEDSVIEVSHTEFNREEDKKTTVDVTPVITWIVVALMMAVAYVIGRRL